jgi:hypothetical protein
MENELQVITTKEVESLVIELRGQKVLLDRDVATLYETETREINKAVRKNSMWWKISTGWKVLKNLR